MQRSAKPSGATGSATRRWPTTSLVPVFAALLAASASAAAPVSPVSTPPSGTPSSGAAPSAASSAEAARSPAAAPSIASETYQLKNGLTVILSREPRLPIVAVEMRYLVGSANEPKGRSGFAHLFEHLMFNGSKHHDKDYFSPFEPIGGQVNGTTSEDRTNYYQQVPARYLELALWMESERLRHLLPALTQQKLDNQRDVVLNERRQRYENVPYGMAWEYLGEALYPKDHPYAHTAIGSPRDLQAANLGDVRAFFQQFYVPSNAVLTIVGDQEIGKTKALIDRYFGSIAGGSRAAMPVGAMPPKREPVHLATGDDKAKLPRVVLAWHTPALFAKGDAELDLLSTVLADGKTSRLYEPLVYRLKVAKDVSAFQVSRQLTSFYMVQATAAPGVPLEKLAAALTAELTKALATPPTSDELFRAKSRYEKAFYQRVESVLSRAELLSGYYHAKGTANWLGDDLGRYLNASPTAVHEAAKQWIGGRPDVRLDMVPAKPDETKNGPTTKAPTTPAAAVKPAGAK